ADPDNGINPHFRPRVTAGFETHATSLVVYCAHGSMRYCACAYAGAPQWRRRAVALASGLWPSVSFFTAD
ncbi:MAG: hypothetical protein AAF441_27610, partial [Pseudomonadota bacterium]